MTPDITVAISTMGSRAARIELPDERAGFRYLVIIQRPDQANLPAWSLRPDVTVILSDDIGLSRSRNIAVERCETPLMLVADDDLVFFPDNIEAGAHLLANRQDLDVLTGRTEKAPGKLSRHNYADHPVRLTRFNSAKTGSCEMMLRLERIRARGLRFDVRFGAGTETAMGEEFVFIADLIAAGLKAEYVPVTFCRHPDDSTGERWSDPRTVQALSRAHGRVFGWAAPLIRIGYLIQRWKRFPDAASRRLYLFSGSMPR